MPHVQIQRDHLSVSVRLVTSAMVLCVQVCVISRLMIVVLYTVSNSPWLWYFELSYLCGIQCKRERISPHNERANKSQRKGSLMKVLTLVEKGGGGVTIIITIM